MKLSDLVLIARRNRMAIRIAEALREQGLTVAVAGSGNELIVGHALEDDEGEGTHVYTVIVSNRRTKK